jgi:hypothetical protein
MNTRPRFQADTDEGEAGNSDAELESLVNACVPT